jgi:hypothetical protein
MLGDESLEAVDIHVEAGFAGDLAGELEGQAIGVI